MSSGKILVTGGSGFIGTNVIDVLLERGWTVANLDIAPPRKQAHRSLWLQGNILDRDRLNAIFAQVRPDAVIHLAAYADVNSREWKDFASIHEGTANVTAAIDADGGVKRFLNTSTQLVIGPGEQAASLVDFHPYTLYGEAKAHAEKALLAWPTDVHWVTVRPTNIWGPHHPGFPSGMWKYIAKGVYLHPDCDEPVCKSYGYVRNTAEQIVTLIEADRAATDHQIFYCADAVIDSSEWVDAFSRALTGRPTRRVPISLLKLMGKAGDLIRRIGIPPPIDSGRVHRMTQGYHVPLEATLALTGAPRVSLEEGVRETVEWLRHPQAEHRE